MYFSGKENGIRDFDEKSAGCGISVKKERECGIRTPPPPASTPSQTLTEEHLNLSKSGFVSEEGQGGCKSQNIAVRALKGNVLYQIWFKCAIQKY